MSSIVTGERLGLRDEVRQLKIGESFKQQHSNKSSKNSSNGLNNGLNFSTDAFHSIRCKCQILNHFVSSRLLLLQQQQ